MSARAPAEGNSTVQLLVMYPHLHPPRLQWLEQKECCYSTVASRQLCTVQCQKLLPAVSFQLLAVAPLLQAVWPLCRSDRRQAASTAYLMWQLQFWERSSRLTLSSCLATGL